MPCEQPTDGLDALEECWAAHRVRWGSHRRQADHRNVVRVRVETHDLDGADPAEVRRRVVEPVVHALLRPGELDWLRVQIGSPRRRWADECREQDAPRVRVLLSARGEGNPDARPR